MKRPAATRAAGRRAATSSPRGRSSGAPAPKRRAPGTRAAGRPPGAGPDRLAFFSREWARAAREAVNAGPGPDARAKKIERFWEWIEKAKQHVNCQLGLAVTGLPANGRRGARDCLLLDLEAGRCVRARLVAREEAELSATYILAGSYADWRDIMAGFDLGRAVMYRKLLLEKGEVLEFFKSIYYWTESLSSIQRIPTAMPAD
ncbi:MAG TPA: hypothetical protein VMS86_10105, partial [Thermoanaerobaculia bacterium]|nr:hypothetical protein [Thermoanaerobaculia bacterium]